MRRRVLFAGAPIALVAVVAAVPGCLVGDLTDIPCLKDEQCPDVHFCDIPAGVCVVLSESESPPAVSIPGVIDGAGEFSISPFVEAGVRTDLKLVIENSGALDAENFSLDLTRLACTQLLLDSTDIPDRIAGDARVEVGFSVEASGCGTPTIQDWFVFFSGRSSRGTFNINVARTQP